MASLLARRAVHTAYTRAAYTNHTRKIHSNPVAQQGWLATLLQGSKGDGTAAAKGAVKKGPGAVRLAEGNGVPPAESVAARAATTTLETSTPSTSGTTIPKQRSKPKRRSLSPEEKSRRYNDTVAFITPRLGRHPELKVPKIRKTTWIRLLGVCQTEEELRKVVDLFPKWRDMGNQFEGTFSETFIRRCLHLNAPQFALDVLGNFAKYNVPLTLTGARELLNATYDTQPLSSVITITSLFDVYRLPPVVNDLPCLSMVISACFKDGRPDALVVGKALLPYLKAILKSEGSQEVSPTQEKGSDMPSVWAGWALGKADKLLFKMRGKREAWLRDWRLRRGYIADAGQF